jgi:hypothetical protein
MPGKDYYTILGIGRSASDKVSQVSSQVSP